MMYNKREIFRRAWGYKLWEKISLAEALRKSWQDEKEFSSLIKEEKKYDGFCLLKGSPKQIKWAEEIRAKIMYRLERNYKLFLLLYTSIPSIEDRENIGKAILDLSKKFKNIASAKVLIENRYSDVFSWLPEEKWRRHPKVNFWLPLKKY